MPDPTPAPLTDEQLHALQAAQIRGLYVDALCEAGDDCNEARQSFDAWLAAVIAKARREAAGEIAREIEREAASLDHLPPTDDPGVADYRMGLRHGMAGSAEHDLVGAAGIARQIGATMPDLTDEQIDVHLRAIRECYDGDAGAVIAAVIAKARREERGRVGRELIEAIREERDGDDWSWDTALIKAEVAIEICCGLETTDD